MGSALAVLVSSLLAWQVPARADLVSPFLFFSNAKRRDADSVERTQVVKARGCTAFFVENTVGKIYVATARHCMNLAVTDWCTSGGKFVDNDGVEGACVKMVAGDVRRDIIILEAAFPDAPRYPLRLAAKVPKLKTQLKMIGYPQDRERRGKLTITEDCWILQEQVRSPHGSGMGDLAARHNCSTYGGNSGGPILEHGTNIVIGLPFTYRPGDYRYRDPNRVSTSAHLALMSDYVTAHRAELEDAGIVLED